MMGNSMALYQMVYEMSNFTNGHEHMHGNKIKRILIPLKEERILASGENGT